MAFLYYCYVVPIITAQTLYFSQQVIELRKNPNPIDRIRVVGTLDKSIRQSSVTPNSMDAEAKMKLLSNEQVQLKKKLEEVSPY